MLIEGDILVPNTIFVDDGNKRSLGLFGIAGNLWPSTVPYKYEIGYRKYYYTSNSVANLGIKLQLQHLKSRIE